MKHSTRLLAFLLLLGLLCFAGTASAATVRGRLVRPNGYPAAGVAVTIFNPQRGRSVAAYAGADGMYYLYNIPAGLYYLEVWVRPGAPPVVYQIRVAEPNLDVPPLSVP